VECLYDCTALLGKSAGVRQGRERPAPARNLVCVAAAKARQFGTEYERISYFPFAERFLALERMKRKGSSSKR
jgi:hypothetical protein